MVDDVDPLSSLTRQFIFNGDNKQVEVKKDGITIGRYYYDGEGKRVKKVTDTETTVFVYSSGKLIAEYSTQLSTTPSAAYTTTDHLGTPRIITDELGQVKARRDFMPFGEELYMNIGGRTGNAGLKYSSSEDDVRQKFTGYQKDDETGLDFAEARMYANELGRFTAVDPLLASGKSANPQTFNRYIYVGNNPIIITDPLGLDWYRMPTGNKKRPYEYKWFDGDPEDGWSAVEFGVGSLYAQVDNMFDGDTELGTVYLNKYGNRYLNQSQYNDFLNRPSRLGCFGFTGICMNNPAAVGDQLRGLRTGAWNFLAGTVNSPIELPILHTAGGSFSAGQLFNIPPFLDYAEYQNRAEAETGFQVQIGLTAASFASGGAIRSGVSNFRAGGTTFGERLFNSKFFGKDSFFFGNNQYGGTSGVFNSPGSSVKAGWSGGRQEMNFFSPRYSNGLILNGKTMGRASFTGGGRQFRLTLGSSGNKGSKHLYIPRTFVPDSIANPLKY